MNSCPFVPWGITARIRADAIGTWLATASFTAFAIAAAAASALLLTQSLQHSGLRVALPASPAISVAPASAMLEHEACALRVEERAMLVDVTPARVAI